MKKSAAAAIVAAAIALACIRPIAGRAATVHESEANEAFTLSTMLRDGDPVIGGGTFTLCPTCTADVAGIHG